MISPSNVANCTVTNYFAVYCMQQLLRTVCPPPSHGVIFEGVMLTAIPITAGKLGLVVITVERYFKIVHAIAHRKYYRDWMTKVGVALPWIGAVCMVLFPAIGTTRIVNGRCLRMGVWPTEGMAFVSRPIRFCFVYYCILLYTCIIYV